MEVKGPTKFPQLYDRHFFVAKVGQACRFLFAIITILIWYYIGRKGIIQNFSNCRFCFYNGDM